MAAVKPSTVSIQVELVGQVYLAGNRALGLRLGVSNS
jgi:hypothetical protein